MAQSLSTIYSTTFEIDMNKPSYLRSGIMSVGGTDYTHFHPLSMLPECGGYDDFKECVLKRCAPVMLDELLAAALTLRGVWLSRRVSMSGKKIHGHLTNWSSLYEELGPMASGIDLAIWLAQIYDADPKLTGIGIDFQSSNVVTWQDKEGFQYMIQGALNRHYVDAERFV